MAGEAGRSLLRLRVIYDEVDVAFARQELALAKKGTPVRCSDGCDACCYLLVTCTIPEALAIVQRLRMSGRLRRFKEARPWEAHEAALHEPGMTTLGFMERRLPCPMLDVDAKRCTVYDERPGSCRSYSVVSDPALCAVPGAGVGSPDRLAEREAVTLTATAIARELDVPNVMLPIAVALKWALLVHERGAGALRAALSSTAFVSDEAIIFYWARLEFPDGRTYERLAGEGSILCRVCGTTSADPSHVANLFCDRCGLHHRDGGEG